MSNESAKPAPKEPAPLPPRVWIHVRPGGDWTTDRIYLRDPHEVHAAEVASGRWVVRGSQYLSVAEAERLASTARAEGMMLAYEDCIHMANVRRKKHNNSLITSLHLKYADAKAASARQSPEPEEQTK